MVPLIHGGVFSVLRYLRKYKFLRVKIKERITVSINGINGGPGDKTPFVMTRVCARALGGQTTEAMAPKPWFRELPRSRRALEKKRHQSRRFAGIFLVPPFLK